MELIGELKEKIEQTKTKDEAKKTIAEARMLIGDEELEKVSGGADVYEDSRTGRT